MATAIPNNNSGWSQRYSTIIQTITVASLFIAGFWVAVIAPLANKMDRFSYEYLFVREHEAFQRRIDDKIAELEKVVNARIDYVKVAFDQKFSLDHESINFLTGSTVNNKIYDTKLVVDQAHFSRLESDIKEIRDFIGGTYSVKDALSQQQKQLDAIRDKMFAPVGNSKP